MASTYGRARSTEAPMTGIEFTNRAKTVPAWRVDNDQQSPLKRTHSTANPPPSPFDPKRNNENAPKPLFGENVRCLFSPPQIPLQSPSIPLPPATASSWNEWSPPVQTPARPGRSYASHKTPEAPEVDMKDVEVDTPPARNDSPERRVISNAAVRRIARKQAKGHVSRSRTRRGNAYVHSDDEDSDEDSGFEDEKDDDGAEGGASRGLIRRSKPVTQNLSNHYTLNMPVAMPMAMAASMDNFAKGEGPYVLAGYLQFGFNFSLIAVFLYLLVQFIVTIQRDVEERIGEYSMELVQESNGCAIQYAQNLCATTPIPAMFAQCAAWEACMARDPRVVGRARVGAGVLAEVVNGFVEGISWKTLAFTLSSLAFLTVFVNALLSLYRSKHHPGRHQNPTEQPPSAGPHSVHQPHFPMHSFSQMHPYEYIHPGGMAAWRPGADAELEQMPRQRRRLEGGHDEAVS